MSVAAGSISPPPAYFSHHRSRSPVRIASLLLEPFTSDAILLVPQAWPLHGTLRAGSTPTV